jgi:hypothetical protein
VVLSGFCPSVLWFLGSGRVAWARWARAVLFVVAIAVYICVAEVVCLDGCLLRCEIYFRNGVDGV